MTILAESLNRTLGDYVLEDQTGFMKGRFMKDNVRKLMNIVEKAQKDKPPTLLSFINAEKAFERIEWLYLQTVISRFGFGLHFRKLIDII